MKKLIIYVMVIIAFYCLLCCHKKEAVYQNEPSLYNNRTVAYRQEYETIRIEGCEYIKIRFIGYKNYEIEGFALTHKGNCKNHQNK